VSDATGSVPRFGEALVEVPVSVSVLRIAQQAIGVMADERRGKLAYEMTGRLAGPAFQSVRFRSSGELALPAYLLPAE
jgi:ribosomal protein S7